MPTTDLAVRVCGCGVLAVSVGTLRVLVSVTGLLGERDDTAAGKRRAYPKARA